MNLKFKCGNEYFIFDIDRHNKRLEVSSEATNYRLTPVPYKSLFDSGKETEQEKETDKLNDGDFIKTITKHMKVLGYKKC